MKNLWITTSSRSVHICNELATWFTCVAGSFCCVFFFFCSSQSKSYSSAKAEPRSKQKTMGKGARRKVMEFSSLSLPHRFLFCPRFSFRAAESLTSQTTKEKTRHNTQASNMIWDVALLHLMHQWCLMNKHSLVWVPHFQHHCFDKFQQVCFPRIHLEKVSIGLFFN